MYICIGTHRINVDQIREYVLDLNTKDIMLYFTESDYIIFTSEEYDLDTLILELDRVCNPKVLKGKLDEK